MPASVPSDAAAPPVSGPPESLLQWDEVRERCAKGERLLVVESTCYDVAEWVERHPGGKVLLTFVGEDATDAVAAFHRPAAVRRWLPTLRRVGSVPRAAPSPLLADFRALRAELDAQGKFTASLMWFGAQLAHILALEAAGWVLLWAYGAEWAAYFAAVALFVTAQAQCGWLQHDVGHHSVLPYGRGARLLQLFLINHLKGASASWWNFRHFLHHAKPNVQEADPDINLPYVFVLGRDMARAWAKKQRDGRIGGAHQYHWQQWYWFAVGPPLLLPFFFHYENALYLFGNALFGATPLGAGLRRDTYGTKRYRRSYRAHWWCELLAAASFYARWALLYTALVPGGWAGLLKLYFLVRLIESHWFVWVTQMSHLPQRIAKYDAIAAEDRDWPLLQADATCNVTSSVFNDWFTGHLNYQIEHHLFPRMPRHNYAHASRLVRALFDRHGVRDRFQTKTLWGAFADVVTSLEDYGKAWHAAYAGGG